MTDSERRLRAQIASHTSWGNTPDRSARTAPARAALDAKFLEQAGGDPKRAASLRSAYFSGLALRSAASRRKANHFKEDADAADAELRALRDVLDGLDL